MRRTIGLWVERDARRVHSSNERARDVALHPGASSSQKSGFHKTAQMPGSATRTSRGKNSGVRSGRWVSTSRSCGGAARSTGSAPPGMAGSGRKAGGRVGGGRMASVVVFMAVWAVGVSRSSAASVWGQKKPPPARRRRGQIRKTNQSPPVARATTTEPTTEMPATARWQAWAAEIVLPVGFIRLTATSERTIGCLSSAR